MSANGVQHRICKKCGCVQRIGFMVRDDLWECVPAKYQNSDICIECFLGFLEDSLEEGEKFQITGDDFTVIGVGGQYDHCHLHGMIVGEEFVMRDGAAIPRSEAQL